MHIGMGKLALRITRCLVGGIARRLMAAKDLEKTQKVARMFFAAINVYFDIDAD